MKKMEAYIEADKKGSGYIANLILMHHHNAAKKLKGLVNLLNAGHSVDVAGFSIDTLKIDGHKASWIVLEEWEKRYR